MNYQKGQNKRCASDSKAQTIETLTVDLGDLDTTDNIPSIRRIVPNRSINLEELRVNNQRRITEGGTPSGSSSNHVTPSIGNTKKQKTTFDYFVDQELQSIASEEFISEEFVKHVGKGLRKRWQTMSKEEMKIYLDLKNASESAMTAAAAEVNEECPLKLSPELQAALRSFLTKDENEKPKHLFKKGHVAKNVKKANDAAKPVTKSLD